MTQEQALKIIKNNQKTYNLIAEEFSATRDKIWPEMEILVKKYVQSRDKVLDLGCGNGRLAGILSNVEYLGVDASEKLIQRAQMNQELRIMNQGKINFKHGDILKLDELGDGKFNIIFMFAVLNHIPTKELRLQVLQDIKKLLKPDGLLIMTDWNLWNISSKKSIWKYILKNSYLLLVTCYWLLKLKDVITLWQSGDKKKSGELYYRAFTLRELNKLFKRAGFKTVENYYSYDGQPAHWWNGKNIVSVAN